MGIEMLPGYIDPYSERILTKGEIGCFLSHYNIWKKVHNKSWCSNNKTKYLFPIHNVNGSVCVRNVCPPQVVELRQQQVLVLEDDVRFEPNFKSHLNIIMEDVKKSGLEWELM